jgi:lysozyme family protein
MTAPGDLNRRLLLEAPVETDDGVGGVTRLYDVVTMLWAQVLPLSVAAYGVNSGLGRSGKVLRRALKLPDNSSAVTEAVITATRSIDPRLLIVAICDERLHFLQSLKTWTVFGAGWGRRVADVKSAALAMAADARVVAHGK